MNFQSPIKLAILLIAFGGFITTFSSCDEDPVTTKIHGTITLQNAEIWETWQDSGEVQLTIFPEFSLDPLAGWGVVPDDFFGAGILGGTFAVGAPYNSQNPVVFTYEAGKNTLNYEIELEPGTYSALALGFVHGGIQDPNKKSATLGVEWGDASQVSHGIHIQIQTGPTILTLFEYPTPTEIVVKEGDDLEINFTADFDFVNDWFQ